MASHCFTEPRMSDPCDGWNWSWPANGYPVRADRSDPVSIEGFIPRDLSREVLPRFAFAMPYVRTDWSHWHHDLDWTLESGPAEAPSSIDIVVPYSYRGGTPDTHWQPGDPAEVEIGTPWFVDDKGIRCEVNLTQAEYDRIERWIYENPPEPDYGDDY